MRVITRLPEPREHSIRYFGCHAEEVRARRRRVAAGAEVSVTGAGIDAAGLDPSRPLGRRPLSPSAEPTPAHWCDLLTRRTLCDQLHAAARVRERRVSRPPPTAGIGEPASLSPRASRPNRRQGCESVRRPRGVAFRRLERELHFPLPPCPARFSVRGRSRRPRYPGSAGTPCSEGSCKSSARSRRTCR